jgi:hypothetical protein
MRTNDAPQLSFGFADPKARPTGLFIATRALRTHRSCNLVIERARYVRRFFPEFGELPIRVGLTRAASGMAVPGGNEVWFNPNLLSYHTITHEFVHLLQGKHGIPTGERSCDLFSLARHWTLNDTAPYYVRIPTAAVDGRGRVRPVWGRLLYDTALEAIELRLAGRRNYISHFEKKLRHMVKNPGQASPTGQLDPEPLL